MIPLLLATLTDDELPPDPPAGTGSPPTEIGVGRARIGIGF